MTLALTFLNTKNVVLDTIDPPRRLDRKSKKLRPPEHSYKVIHVMPLKAKLKKGYVPTSTDIAQARAWHKVRGTFKTYTEEHRLFGKWSGTFWFAAHTRGTKEEGEITSEYEVDLDR
jgi:hypothetical protein